MPVTLPHRIALRPTTPTPRRHALSHHRLNNHVGHWHAAQLRSQLADLVKRGHLPEGGRDLAREWACRAPFSLRHHRCQQDVHHRAVQVYIEPSQRLLQGLTPLAVAGTADAVGDDEPQMLQDRVGMIADLVAVETNAWPRPNDS